MTGSTDTAAPPLLPSELTLGVQIGKRIYPNWDKSLPESPSETTTSLQFQESPQTLSDRLYPILWNRLQVSQWSLDNAATQDELIPSYHASLAVIEQYYADWRRFVRVLCETRLSWRHESGEPMPQLQAQAMESRLERMINAICGGWKNPTTIVTAELSQRDPRIAYAQLQTSIETQLLDFCRTIELSLEAMVDQQLVGLIEWIGKTGCRYHFFRESIVQKGSRRETTRPRRVHRRIQVEDITSLDVAYSRERHVHQLMNASSVPLANHQLPIPEKEQAVIDAVPGWLRDFTRIAEGTLICLTVVEREFYHQSWTVREPRPIGFYHNDPGLILDQFVLTGWGPDDIQEEEQRRTTAKVEQEQTAQQTLTPLWLSGSVLATLCFILLAGLRPGSHLATALSLALGVAFTTQAISSYRDSRRDYVGWPHFLTSLLLMLGISFTGGLLLTCFQRVDQRPIAMTATSVFITGLLAILTASVFQRPTTR